MAQCAYTCDSGICSSKYVHMSPSEDKLLYMQNCVLACLGQYVLSISAVLLNRVSCGTSQVRQVPCQRGVGLGNLTHYECALLYATKVITLKGCWQLFPQAGVFCPIGHVTTVRTTHFGRGQFSYYRQQVCWAHRRQLCALCALPQWSHLYFGRVH